MAFEFKMPDVGEGTTEGEILRWLVREGDRVGLDQPLVEMQTDKAVVELPAPRAGVILACHGKEGDVVAVGQTLVVIGEAEEAVGAPAAAAAAPPAPADPYMAPSLRAAAVQAAPATRRLAKELGIDLAGLRGSGPGGRIVPRDVRLHAEAARSAGPPPTERETAPGEREPVSWQGLRRQIRDHLTRSVREIPQVTVVEKVDATEWVRWRQSLQQQAAAQGTRVSYLALFCKVVDVVLRLHPELNARWEGDTLYRYRAHHIGVAVDTPDGLLAPVLRDVASKTVWEVAAELQALVEGARARRLNRDQLTGSTVTVTSGGPAGGMFATPIINYPEVAIFGLYRIQAEPAVWQDTVAVRQMMHVSLTFDHRVVDGMAAARALASLRGFIERPESLLAELR